MSSNLSTTCIPTVLIRGFLRDGEQRHWQDNWEAHTVDAKERELCPWEGLTYLRRGGGVVYGGGEEREKYCRGPGFNFGDPVKGSFILSFGKALGRHGQD